MDGTTGSERVLAHIHTVERAMSGRLHSGDLKLMSWFVDRMKAAAEADGHHSRRLRRRGPRPGQGVQGRPTQDARQVLRLRDEATPSTV